MLALVADPTPRLVTDYPEPVPGPGEALIRVDLAGICSTDLELVRGYRDFKGVLGHEFVGTVVGSDADRRRIGRRVVGEINVGCGDCDFCRRGIPSQCPDRRAVGIARWDGALAEFLKLPLANLHLVPDELPDEVAVFAEPVAAALQVTSLVHVRPEQHVAVLGDGKLGLLVAQVLAITGAEVTLIGHHPAKLELAARWGLNVCTAVEGRLFDVVVDSTGSAAGFSDALLAVRPRGTIVLKSTYRGLAEADLSRVVVDEIRVIGSRCGPFVPALRLLRSNAIRVHELVEARYPLVEGLAALDHAGRRGALKILVAP
jgi:threonine dehydrogenase-like Zn-dependent dehydrogenase